MNERELIERIRMQAGRPRGLVRGIGDDCAIYAPRAGEELLFTTDLLIEGVHFLHSTHKATDVGHKTLARGLSDIAAMGGTPRCCLVSLAIPATLRGRWLDDFYKGLLALAKKTGTALAGGDLAQSEKMVCDIVVCGSVKKGRALRRDTAKTKDAIYVSGALGGSALGLATGKGRAWKKHLRPEPRLKLGQALHKLGATACMDLSDGLSTDLQRLCAASGVSADLDGELPMFDGASIEQALHGGEDYELLFTLRPDVSVPWSLAGVPLTRIGTVLKGHAGRVKVDEFELQPLGYDHFR